MIHKLVYFAYKYNSHIPTSLILIHFLINKYAQFGRYSPFYLVGMGGVSILCSIINLSSYNLIFSDSYMDLSFVLYFIFNNVAGFCSFGLFLSDGKPFVITDIILNMLFIIGIINNLLFTLVEIKLFTIGSSTTSTSPTVLYNPSQTTLSQPTYQTEHKVISKDIIIEPLTDAEVATLTESIDTEKLIIYNNESGLNNGITNHPDT